MPTQSKQFTIPSTLFNFKDQHGRRPGNPTGKGKTLANQILGYIQRNEKSIPITPKNKVLIEWLSDAINKRKLEEVVWYLKQECTDTPEKRATSFGTGRDSVWSKSRLV